MEILELLGKGPPVAHPEPNGVFQVARDVQQGASSKVSCGQVEGAVPMALLATAGGLAAGSFAFDQGGSQEGQLADQLDDS